MTGREFLELDSPQKRLILERFKRMEIIQKMFNELPQADQSKLLAKQTAGSNTGPSHAENIILRNMLIRGPLMKFSLTAVTGKKIVATASQPFCHFTLEVCVNSGRNLCNHGKYFLAANSSLCGLAANNFFRSILHIRKAALVSAMPMAVIPFLSTAAVYEAFVHNPLFSGQLNCEVCAVIRGGLVGAVVGGFYPIFLAIPLNGSLAARYMSAPLPGKENVLRYWITTAQPVFRKMSVGILVQALTGLYLATKQHGIYIKMLLQMNSSRDPEELPE